MVIGLNLFKKHFAGQTDHYILIGGSACDWHMEQLGVPFRATKDLDIILVVEALSDDFVNHFWEFIKQGDYAVAQKSGNICFYRFSDPKVEGFPKMIELFARKPDLIAEKEGMHLTDIPTGEEVSSLSAILLDDEYYAFTLANSEVTDGLRHANSIALIALKAKAFLNNKARKEIGQQVRQDDIDKHKRDVIRLAITLEPQLHVVAPDSIRNDLREYVSAVIADNPDIKAFLGKQAPSLEAILQQLSTTFHL
jgi:hypothetical protein